MERTLVLIKPDGVQRRVVGEIIGRFERKGLQLVAMKMIHLFEELAAKHYAEHEGRPFYNDLIDFITSSPVVAMVWQGRGAINIVRQMMGATNPHEAALGTIRGDYGISIETNIIHGSDSENSAKREISLFFNNNEITDYKLDITRWIYGS